MMRYPIFDWHNDTLTSLYLAEAGEARSFFVRGETGHLDLPRALEGGLAGGIFAIFTPPPETSPERDPYFGLTTGDGSYEVSPRSPIEHEYAKGFTDAIIDFLYVLESESAGKVAIARSHQDLVRNLESGVLSVVLHIEGAEAVDEGLSRLEAYYARGLRLLGLVWSRPNAFGHGVPFRYPHSPDTGPGLSEAGKRLVRECNRRGIMLDLAHISEKGFWDMAGLSDAPLVVSHAGVHAICPSTRNLTDEQIDAIGASNGLVGVIFEPSNTRADGWPDLNTPLDQIVRHIDYVAQRIGVDHVAFGSDFDGADVPHELRDAAGLPRLIQALREGGYGHDALEKIAYKNWFRVMKQTWEM